MQLQFVYVYRNDAVVLMIVKSWGHLIVAWTQWFVFYFRNFQTFSLFIQ